MKARPTPARTRIDVLETADSSLLDIVDHVINQGVVLSGEVVLGVAGVDLVYLRLSALLAAADRILPHRSRSRTRKLRRPRSTPKSGTPAARRRP